MKKIIYLLAFLISFSFTACNDDSNSDNQQWKSDNLKAYEEVVQDPTWIPLVSMSNLGGPSGVYHKVIKSGEGQERPIQTASVKVKYKGYYYTGTVFDSGSSQNDIPVSFNVNGVVRGFGFALQNMVVGDKWEICIPYFLGYGSTASSTSAMRAYTTLFFELELVEINQHP